MRKNLFKILLCVALSATLLFSLAGCQSANSPDMTGESKNIEAESEAAKTASKKETKESKAKTDTKDSQKAKTVVDATIEKTVELAENVASSVKNYGKIENNTSNADVNTGTPASTGTSTKQNKEYVRPESNPVTPSQQKEETPVQPAAEPQIQSEPQPQVVEEPTAEPTVDNRCPHYNQTSLTYYNFGGYSCTYYQCPWCDYKATSLAEHCREAHGQNSYVANSCGGEYVPLGTYYIQPEEVEAMKAKLRAEHPELESIGCSSGVYGHICNDCGQRV